MLEVSDHTDTSESNENEIERCKNCSELMRDLNMTIIRLKQAETSASDFQKLYAETSVQLGNTKEMLNQSHYRLWEAETRILDTEKALIERSEELDKRERRLAEGELQMAKVENSSDRDSYRKMETELQGRLGKAVAHLADLGSQLVPLQNKVMESDRMRSEAEQKLAKAEEKITELTRLHSQFEQKISEERKVQESAQGTIRSWELRLEEMYTVLHEEKLLTKRLELEFQHKEDIVQSQKNEIQELFIKLQQSSLKLEEKQQRIIELENLLEYNESETARHLERANLQVSQLTEQLSTLQRSCEGLNEQIRIKDQVVGDYDDKIRELSGMLETAGDVLRARDTELAQAKANLTAFSMRLEEFGIQLDTQNDISDDPNDLFPSETHTSLGINEAGSEGVVTEGLEGVMMELTSSDAASLGSPTRSGERQKNLSSLQNRLKRSVEELAQILQLEAKVKQLQDERRDIELQLEDAMVRLNESQEMYVQANLQLVEKNTQIRSTEDFANDLSRRLEEMEDALEMAEGKIQATMTANEEANTREKTARHELKSVHEEVFGLQRRNRQLETQLQEQLQLITDTKQQLESSSDKIIGLENRLADSRRQMNEMSSRLLDSNSQLNIAREQIVQLEYQLASETDRMTAEVRSLQHDTVTQQELRQRLIKSSSNISNLGSQIVQLQAQLLQLETEKSEAFDIQKELQHKLTVSEMNRQSTNTKLDEALLTINELRSELGNAQSKVMQQDSQLLMLQSPLVSMKLSGARKGLVERELADQRSKLVEAATELTLSRQEIEHLKAEIEDKNKEILTLKFHSLSLSQSQSQSPTLSPDMDSSRYRTASEIDFELGASERSVISDLSYGQIYPPEVEFTSPERGLYSVVIGDETAFQRNQEGNDSFAISDDDCYEGVGGEGVFEQTLDNGDENMNNNKNNNMRSYHNSHSDSKGSVRMGEEGEWRKADPVETPLAQEGEQSVGTVDERGIGGEYEVGNAGNGAVEGADRGCAGTGCEQQLEGATVIATVLTTAPEAGTAIPSPSHSPPPTTPAQVSTAAPAQAPQPLASEAVKVPLGTVQEEKSAEMSKFECLVIQLQSHILQLETQNSDLSESLRSQSQKLLVAEKNLEAFEEKFEESQGVLSVTREDFISLQLRVYALQSEKIHILEMNKEILENVTVAEENKRIFESKCNELTNSFNDLRAEYVKLQSKLLQSETEKTDAVDAKKEVAHRLTMSEIKRQESESKLQDAVTSLTELKIEHCSLKVQLEKSEKERALLFEEHRVKAQALTLMAAQKALLEREMVELRGRGDRMTAELRQLKGELEAMRHITLGSTPPPPPLPIQTTQSNQTQTLERDLGDKITNSGFCEDNMVDVQLEDGSPSVVRTAEIGEQDDQRTAITSESEVSITGTANQTARPRRQDDSHVMVDRSTDTSDLGVEDTASTSSSPSTSTHASTVLEADFKVLEKRLNETLTLYYDAKTETRTLQSTVRELETEITENNETIKDLLHNLSIAEKSRDACEGKLSETTASFNYLRAEANAVKTDLLMAEQERAEAIENMNQINHKLALADVKCTVFEKKFEDTSRALNTSRKELGDVQSKLLTLESERNDLAMTVEDLSRQVLVLEMGSQSLETKLAETLITLNETRAELSTMQSRVLTQSQASIRVIHSQSSQLETVVTELRKRCIELEDLLAGARTELADTVTQLAVMKGAKMELEKRLLEQRQERERDREREMGVTERTTPTQTTTSSSPEAVTAAATAATVIAESPSSAPAGLLKPPAATETTFFPARTPSVSEREVSVHLDEALRRSQDVISSLTREKQALHKELDFTVRTLQGLEGKIAGQEVYFHKQISQMSVLIMEAQERLNRSEERFKLLAKTMRQNSIVSSPAPVTTRSASSPASSPAALSPSPSDAITEDMVDVSNQEALNKVIRKSHDVISSLSKEKLAVEKELREVLDKLHTMESRVRGVDAVLQKKVAQLTVQVVETQERLSRAEQRFNMLSSSVKQTNYKRVEAENRALELEGTVSQLRMRNSDLEHRVRDVYNQLAEAQSKLVNTNALKGKSEEGLKKVTKEKLSVEAELKKATEQIGSLVSNLNEMEERLEEQSKRLKTAEDKAHKEHTMRANYEQKAGSAISRLDKLLSDAEEMLAKEQTGRMAKEAEVETLREAYQTESALLSNRIVDLEQALANEKRLRVHWEQQRKHFRE